MDDTFFLSHTVISHSVWPSGALLRSLLVFVGTDTYDSRNLLSSPDFISPLARGSGSRYVVPTRRHNFFFRRANTKEPPRGFENNTMAGKVALITGITGQDGSYLTELLVSKGYTVSYYCQVHVGRDERMLCRQLPPDLYIMHHNAVYS